MHTAEMKRLGVISVLIDGWSADLSVEEFHPYEPAAYVHDPGWTCLSDSEIEYFVSVTGDVYRQPENKRVGVAPVIAGSCDRMEAWIARAMEADNGQA